MGIAGGGTSGGKQQGHILMKLIWILIIFFLMAILQVMIIIFLMYFRQWLSTWSHVQRRIVKNPLQIVPTVIRQWKSIIIITHIGITTIIIIHVDSSRWGAFRSMIQSSFIPIIKQGRKWSFSDSIILMSMRWRWGWWRQMRRTRIPYVLDFLMKRFICLLMLLPRGLLLAFGYRCL